MVRGSGVLVGGREDKGDLRVGDGIGEEKEGVLVSDH